jgi:hypothetical protein
VKPWDRSAVRGLRRGVPKMQVLWVDRDESRRVYARNVAVSRNLAVLEAQDAFAAMGALGRADFDALVVVEEPRLLSMRGLLMLARKRHAGIRVFVLVEPGRDRTALRRVLGVPVECVGSDMPLETLFNVLASQVNATPMPFSVPRTSAVDLAVLEAQTEVLGPAAPAANAQADVEPPAAPAPSDTFSLASPAPTAPPTSPHTAPPSAPPAAPPPAPPNAPVQLEGDLAVSSGSALLLGLYAQELTGRLGVDSGAAEGTLYLLAGEPVYAVDPSGDAGLWDRCVKARAIKPGTGRPHVPEGQLSSVVASMLDGETLHGIFRAMVRDRVIHLAGQHEGSYTFEEDTTFVDVLPLYKLNPVGLVVEAMRRRRPPDRLLERARAMANQYLHPSPGLAAAAGKLTHFMRGKDAQALVDGTRTVTLFFDDSGLGPMLGALLVEVLLDAGLAVLKPAPRRPNASDIVLRQNLPAQTAQPQAPTARLPDADVEEPTNTDGRARNQVFALYARLKPLRLPRQVLGVPAFATRETIDAAYRRLMDALDAQRIPEGSARALLQNRLEEIRLKVTGSYQALLLEMSSPPDGTDSNPF